MVWRQLGTVILATHNPLGHVATRGGQPQPARVTSGSGQGQRLSTGGCEQETRDEKEHGHLVTCKSWNTRD